MKMGCWTDDRYQKHPTSVRKVCFPISATLVLLNDCYQTICAGEDKRHNGVKTVIQGCRSGDVPGPQGPPALTCSAFTQLKVEVHRVTYRGSTGSSLAELTCDSQPHCTQLSSTPSIPSGSHADLGEELRSSSSPTADKHFLSTATRPMNL